MTLTLTLIVVAVVAVTVTVVTLTVTMTVVTVVAMQYNAITYLLEVSLVHSMYMVGLMVGSFGCGRLADAIGALSLHCNCIVLHWLDATLPHTPLGRKKTLFLSMAIASSGSLAGAFMPEYYSYTFTR